MGHERNRRQKKRKFHGNFRTAKKKNPSGSDTWCKYQNVKQKGKMYKHRTAGLPNAVLNTVKTTYMDLCDQSLLEKCLHGKTQNANESFNGVLWSIIPKETFDELLTLQFGAFLAVLQFPP
ncbi:uncharacterized protein TNCV_2800971 [Trichonephila clavipes]|nr:uncharacterized protein TNCV_2800971 [Trichonephila clavipes]